MENAKLVSVRIPADLLREVDAMCAKCDYYSRTDLIVAGLRFVTAKKGLENLRNLLSFYPQFGDVVDEFVFKYHREVKR